MLSVRIIIVVLILLFVYGCGEKELTPEEKAEQYKNEIMQNAPISFEYELKPPSDRVDEQLKEYSGHWIGKWDDKYASQLIVTEINNDKAKFIYSWQGNPNNGISSGVITETAEVTEEGRLVYQTQNESLTFAIDTLLHKIIGVQLIDDKMNNIIMQKVE